MSWTVPQRPSSSSRWSQHGMYRPYELQQTFCLALGHQQLAGDGSSPLKPSASYRRQDASQEAQTTNLSLSRNKTDRSTALARLAAPCPQNPGLSQATALRSCPSATSTFTESQFCPRLDARILSIPRWQLAKKLSAARKRVSVIFDKRPHTILSPDQGSPR